jgi:adenylate cyclase
MKCWQWWGRSRLRSKIFLAFSTLILLLLFFTLGLTEWMVSRQVQATLTQELLVTDQVFRRLIEERAERLQSNSELLASDFALKRVVVTYDSSTLRSVALNYQRRIAVDLLWITDERGILLADSRGSQENNRPLARFSPLAEALGTGAAASAVAEVEGELFQLVAVPVLAPGVIGFVVVGEGIDDETARQLRDETGSQVSFLTQQHLFASSWSTVERQHMMSAGPRVPHWLQRHQQEAFILTLAGERFLSRVVSIDARLSEPLYAVVQRSYDAALAPLSILQQRIAGVGFVAVVVALALGIGLAGGITAPIRTLVGGMGELLRGNLAHRLAVNREDEIGFLAGSFNEMAQGLQEREQIKNTFGRFVSRDVAQAVLGGRVPLAGEQREVTILFQDIRGFTAIGEKTDSAQLIRLLNQFFTEVVTAVEAEGGVVKQFLGDGVMALFGAPKAHTDDPQRAVRAALGIVTRLAELNTRFSVHGFPTLSIGVGIHTGEVVAGLIGPDERVEYGVVGDPVNLASRIEGLTKELAVSILVSSTTAARLGPEFVLGRSATLPVKGRMQVVEVVEVLAYVPGGAE